MDLATTQSDTTERVDPRRARSRAAIATAVETLTERGTALTIANIVATAGISRSTFYLAYDGLGALLIETLSGIFRDIARLDLTLRGTATPSEIAAATTRELVAAFERNRALCRSVFTSEVAVSVMSALTDSFAEHAKETMRLAAPDHVDPSTAARFVGSGSLTVLVDWVLDDHPTNAERVRATLCALLPAWLFEHQKENTP